MIGVAVLHRHLHIAGEGDGIIAMKAIEAVAAAGAVSAGALASVAATGDDAS